jgi:hypothetical protein
VSGIGRRVRSQKPGSLRPLAPDSAESLRS